MSLRKGELLIDDGTPDGADVIRSGPTGCVPRPADAPREKGVVTFGAVNMPLTPRSEWSARIQEMVETESRLSDIRLRGNSGRPIPSLDQNYGDGVRWGYCWNHSVVHAAMAVRAANNAPYVPLSAFAGAVVLKRGKNEGGWSPQGLEFAMEVGIPSQDLWPQKNDSLRLDTPAMRADAAKYRVSEGWVEVDAQAWERDLTFDQVMTLLLARVPVTLDLWWWGHSVCGLDPVEVEPGSFGIRIWNSWADSWGDRGMGVLRGDKAVPNLAVAPRSLVAA